MFKFKEFCNVNVKMSVEKLEQKKSNLSVNDLISGGHCSIYAIVHHVYIVDSLMIYLF